MVKAGNFPWCFPGSSCGESREFRLTENSLDFLAGNPFYTKRFAHYVGKRCRSSTIKDIAKELMLGWHAVKELKEYMEGLLRKTGTPAPAMIAWTRSRSGWGAPSGSS